MRSARRPGLPTHAASPADDEARLARLRRAMVPPPRPPAELVPLFSELGGLAPGAFAEALRRYQALRQELRAVARPELEVPLMWLHKGLAWHWSPAEEPVRARALAEATLECVTRPEHQQVLWASLARQAAWSGAPAAAEWWLAHCDGAAEELEMDTQWSMAAATIATVRGDAVRVLEVLGRPRARRPIHPNQLAMSIVLRADALEQLGELDTAVAELSELLLAQVGAGRRLAGRLLKPGTRPLCERSYPRAEAKTAAAASSWAASGGGGRIGVRIGQVLLVAGAAGTLVTALRALGGAAATAFLPDWLRDVLLATGLPLLLMGAVWLRIGRRELRAEQRAAHLRLHGEPARGTVVSIRQRRYLEEELVRVDLVLEVNREGLPSYRASTRLHLLPEETVVYAPGATVAVRVNPDRPSEVIVEHG